MTMSDISAGEDAVDLAHRAVDLARANPDDVEGIRAVREALRNLDGAETQALDNADRRQPLPVTQLDEDWPPTLLRAAGLGGALLTAGEILVVAGDGGIGKSTLLASTLLGIAGRESTGMGPLPSGIFEAAPGPVLYAAHEDRAAVLGSIARWAATSGPWANASDDARRAAYERFHVLEMRARPLYGPGVGGSYNVRPDRLPGWADLWEAAAAIRPVVVVVDPALSAYVGNSNDAAPVREFLDAMRREAEDVGCGLILAAHSIKSARRTRGNEKPDPFDVGQVGGSAAWVDQPRGVLSLTRSPGKGDGRTLAIVKANYGPAVRLLDLTPTHKGERDSHQGALSGFVGDSGGWMREADWKAKHKNGAEEAEGGDDDRIPAV